MYPPQCTHSCILISICCTSILHTYCSNQLIQIVNNRCIEGIDKMTGKPKLCKPCMLEKLKKLPFRHKGQKATHPFQIIHSDVGGPVTLANRHGNKYWISFIDGYGHFPWVYFMKRKDEALSRFCEFKNDVWTYLEGEIGELHLFKSFINFF